MTKLRQLKPSPHPGVVIRTCVLPALSMTVSQAARDLQITRQTLHRILAGDAPVTTEMAARLERFCGVPSQFWLTLQHDCELERIHNERCDLFDRIPSHKLPDKILREIGAIDG